MNQNELRSSLSGSVEMGNTYIIEYVAGLSNESEYELLAHTSQTMQVEILPTHCQTSGITGTFPSDMIYILGSATEVVNLTGINDGDCQFSVSLDFDPLDPFLGTIADIGLTLTPPTVL